jgi:DNA ligase (NAD+)
MNPEAEISQLRERIAEANHAYYILDAPTLPDAEFDRLFRRLQALEQEHPELLTPDSPTQRVGGGVATSLAKHTHLRPMVSLANAFEPEELVAWEARNIRLNEAVRTSGYTTEVKIDGAAISLTYRNGALAVGATRGNGTVGEVVTENLKTIADIPLALKGTGHPPLMEIRGEVYMTHTAFAALNREREKEGEPLFANPRNTASGGLRQLDPKAVRKRRLRMFAFHIEVIEGDLDATTQWETLDQLEAWGFRVEPNRARHKDLAAVQAKIAEYEVKLREKQLDFDADGVVVKVDRLALHEELGIVGGREPRWAIARKFAPEIAETDLLEIRVNVGRTGALNPYAVLAPVEVGGVTVTNATLHNEDVIEQKGIQIGDRVQVMRAGEVIPQVVGPVLEARKDGRTLVRFAMPDSCPACGTPVVRHADEAMRFCPNSSCPGRILESIVHFASRDAMDIRGLGYERVRQLLDAKLIENVADLYHLTVAQLTGLDRFASQSATQLVNAIAASTQQPLSMLLFGLGIRHVGKTVAQVIARHFGSMGALSAATQMEIEAVSQVGPTIAEAVSEFFAAPVNQALLRRLAEAGLTLVEPQTGPVDGPLSGGTYVITGTLPNLSRADATALIEKAGGKVSGSVSKKTSALVAGEDAGSKLDKARDLKVEIIDEAELLRRVHPT